MQVERGFADTTLLHAFEKEWQQWAVELMEAGELFPAGGIDTPPEGEEPDVRSSGEDSPAPAAAQKQKKAPRRKRAATGAVAEAVAEALEQGTEPVVAMLRRGSRKRKHAA